MHRHVFDPVAQHRDWCPWVSVEKEKGNLDGSVFVGCEAELPQPGWKAALTLFLSMKRSLSPVGASPSQVSQISQICILLKFIYLYFVVIFHPSNAHFFFFFFHPGSSWQIKKGVLDIPTVAGILPKPVSCTSEGGLANRGDVILVVPCPL